jgi:hypothetical protein
MYFFHDLSVKGNFADALYTSEVPVPANCRRESEVMWHVVGASQTPSIEQITEMLGKADSISGEEDVALASSKLPQITKNFKVAWHSYGWLSFGVSDGKVALLRMDWTKNSR